MSISKILQILSERELDAYVVSHANRFLGQDILESEHKLKYLCGFSGSAGALIISHKGCFLLVDGRYELQAQQEVDIAKIEIINKMPTMKNVYEILAEKGLQKIGYDAWCFSAADMMAVKQQFADLHLEDIGDLVKIDSNALIKTEHRDVKYTEKSHEEKLQIVADMLKQKSADYLLLTAADSVSWLLNIYAHDLPYSPVVRAYALIDAQEKVVLFADNLQTNFDCRAINELLDFLQKNKANVIYDPQTTPKKLVKENMTPVHDICQQLKVVKNKTEIAGMIDCHIRDGVAVTKFLMWLEQNWQGKTELDVVQKLHELRAEQKDFFSESFATIAASGANGAIVHYQPTEKSNAMLQNGDLFLLDSGGQYLDGTTDVTRTVIIGRPNRKQITDFTLVLKAHIALAHATFPLGIRGAQLDGITRAVLWQNGLDYKHGTGHGVACFGNVHEGPVSISAAANYAFEENVVVSDEPGIYKEGKYGIRIESLLRTVKSDKKGFLEFVPLTKVPLDKRLIDEYMLTADEREWLNEYHQDVYDCLAPYMSKDEKKWLKKACSPL